MSAHATVSICGAINIGAEYTPDELDALQAVDRYRTSRNRRYPALVEILAVLRSRGWQRTGPNTAMPPRPGTAATA